MRILRSLAPSLVPFSFVFILKVFSGPRALAYALAFSGFVSFECFAAACVVVNFGLERSMYSTHSDNKNVHIQSTHRDFDRYCSVACRPSRQYLFRFTLLYLHTLRRRTLDHILILNSISNAEENRKWNEQRNVWWKNIILKLAYPSTIGFFGNESERATRTQDTKNGRNEEMKLRTIAGMTNDFLFIICSQRSWHTEKRKRQRGNGIGRFGLCKQQQKNEREIWSHSWLEHYYWN